MKKKPTAYTAAFVAGLILTGAVACNAGTDGPHQPLNATATTPPTDPSPSQPSTPTQQAQPADSVGDGTYLVGTDIKAGQYKTDGPDPKAVIPNCYSARMKDNSGAITSIIANNNSAGPDRVTVSSGEYLQLSGGCTWNLVG